MLMLDIQNIILMLDILKHPGFLGLLNYRGLTLFFLASFVQKANNNELKMAWDCYLNANDCWKSTEAKKQAKTEIKVWCLNAYISCQIYVCYLNDVNPLLCMQRGVLKRIEEKKNELDSFELQISNVNFSHIDERERNLVSAACSLVLLCNL